MFTLLGREPAALLRAITRAPALLGESARCARIFDDPAGVARAYFFREAYPGSSIALRGGGRVHLANPVEDVITLMVVLVRDDYGPVERGSVVLDIGANIGAFAVKALRDGAASVYCLEPNPPTLDALRRTIADVDRAGAVKVDARAVWHTDGETLYMQTASSPASHVSASSAGTATVPVTTVSLATVFAALPSRIDLVKMDCEGAEYPVVLRSDPALWTRVGEVRMEYHDGRVDELAAHLARGGLELVSRVKAVVDGKETGTLHFRRRPG